MQPRYKVFNVNIASYHWILSLYLIKENEDNDFSSDSEAYSFDSRRIKEAEERYGNVSVTSSEQLSLPSLKRNRSNSSTSSSIGIFSSASSDHSSSQRSSLMLPLMSMAAELLTNVTNDSSSYIYLYIQMELCREENLAHWLKTRQPVELNVYQMYREILSAVKYLHSQVFIYIFL